MESALSQAEEPGHPNHPRQAQEPGHPYHPSQAGKPATRTIYVKPRNAVTERRIPAASSPYAAA